MEKNLEISGLLDFYGELLTQKQREAIEFYYNQDLSLAEIAEHSGITRQGVRDNIKRAEAQLLEYEAALGLAARFREITAGLDEIMARVGALRELNRRAAFQQEAEDHAQRILEIAQNLSE
jgi:Uncharacterized protein conserved in bacteria